MYNNWITDLTNSSKALSKVLYTILPQYLKGKIHNIETSNNEILVLLDTKSGIDLIDETSTGLLGIASRVQFCPIQFKPYNTFTIRAERHTGTKTEYEKRTEQIEKGYLYPALTMQLYFDNKIDMNFLSGALIKTINLYRFIKEHPDKIKTRYSDNKFYYINFSDLKDYGIGMFSNKIKYMN